MAGYQSLDPGRQQDAAALQRRAAEPAPAAERGAMPHPVLNLQRQIGNAAIVRMIAQRQSADEEEEAPVQAKHDQALAQRAGEEDEEEPVQAKPEVGLEGGPIGDALAGRINAQRGGGAPLDVRTRARMEGAFGTSFEDVRLHTDDESDALNRGISAKAFTTGSDIFFRRDTGPGDAELLAHELTHVVQQRSMSGGGPLTVGPAGDSYEQEADATARAIQSAPATNGPGAALGQGEGGEVARRQASEEEEAA